MEIIKAHEEDFGIINRLAHIIWPPTFGSILSAEQIDYMLEILYSIPSIKNQVENKNHVFILVKDEDKYIGYASYEINYNNSFKTKIHKIYLLPETHGKGIGKEVMNYIAKIAIENNNHSLILNVNRHNPAIHFYNKTGFEIVGEEDIDIGNNYFMNDYVMEKRLG